MNLILFGPPGSGKGTQAELLEKKLGLRHVSTGEILRAAVKQGTRLGKKAADYMDRGKLVPDELIVAMLREELEEGEEKTKGFLFDGFPRNLEQVKHFESLLEELQLGDYAVVSLEVSDEEIMKRLLGRRFCENCKKGYNEHFGVVPEKDGVCDKCGGKVVRRSDDNEGTIKERLRVYKEQTEPALNFFRDRGKLIRVRGEGSVNDISRSIIEKLEGVV